jgi:hypothetical protein
MPNVEAIELLNLWGYTPGELAPPIPLVRFIGDWNIAAFFYRIVEGISRTTNPEGRFYWADTAAENELHLTRQKIRTIRTKLEESGLIAHVVRKAEGAPQNHYTANFARISKLWEEYQLSGHSLTSNPRLLGKKTNLSAKARGKYVNSTNRLAQFNQSEAPNKISNLQDKAINSTNRLAQFNQTNINGASSVPPSLSIQPNHNSNKDIYKEGEGGTPAPLLTFYKVFGYMPNEDGAGIILRAVKDNNLWEENLRGWKANTRWSTTNIDGMVQRYQKRQREYDRDYPEGRQLTEAPAPPDQDTEDRKARERKAIYDSGD